MKSLNRMDLDEWELFPDDGFLEMNDEGGNKIYDEEGSSTSSVMEMNYFICPPKPHDSDEGEKVSVEMKTEFVDMKMDSPESQAQIEAALDDSAEGARMDNVWKRGIGAICSFGVAAAAFCIILLNQKQQLRFQIYTTTHKVRGVPISRARITCGGYYDAAPPSL